MRMTDFRPGAAPRRLRRTCVAPLTVMMLALGLSALGSAHLSAQNPDDETRHRVVVAKSVSMSNEGGRLELQFDEGSALSIELDGDQVIVNGRPIGQRVDGGELRGELTTLLEAAARLENGELRRMLLDWTPDSAELHEDHALAAEIDRAIEEALASVGLDRSFRGQVPASADAEVRIDASGAVDADGVLDAAGTQDAAGARDAAPRRIVVDIQTRRDMDAGESDEGAAAIEGESVRIDRAFSDDLRQDIREEIEAQIRRELQREQRPRGVIDRVSMGIGRAFAHLVTLLVLGLFGAVVHHFAGPNLERVAREAQRNPLKALAVGTAGSFLLLPIYVIGAVALVLTIIGLPALLLWLPLFPVLVVLAMGLGYLAMARNLGSWAVRQQLPGTQWIRETQPVTLILGGALVLGAGFVLGDLASVIPFAGPLVLLLFVTATLLSTAATLVGFGAVLLTRMGTRTASSGRFDFGEAFEEASQWWPRATEARPTGSGSTRSGATGAGSTGAGSTSAGSASAGTTDARAGDFGAADSGAADVGAADVGAPDVGVAGSGAADSGAADSGVADSGGPSGTGGASQSGAESGDDSERDA